MWGIWVDILFNLKQIGFLGSHVIWKNSGCVLESDRSQPSSPKPGGGSNKFLRRSIWSQLFLLSMVLVYFLQNKIGKLNRRTYDTETVTTVARTKVFFFGMLSNPFSLLFVTLKNIQAWHCAHCMQGNYDILSAQRCTVLNTRYLGKK